MNDQWKTDSKALLKGAQACNDFFATQVFVEQRFPIKIPQTFARLIRPEDPLDPLLLQVLPKASNSIPEFVDQPLADDHNSPVDGLIRKYHNRVLLIASRSCAIHCQYCFRQHFDYAQHDAISNWAAIEAYLTIHPEIDEVILSGGDPLSLSDDKLAKLIGSLEAIEHIQTLRIHTRTAVAIPSRLTDQLIQLLNNTSLKVVLVFHINHAREISEAFAQRLTHLSSPVLLNQSVLLNQINDQVGVLEALSQALFKLGILPYYLHMLDKVDGAQHYWVSDDRAIELHQQLQKKLPGYLVPRLVRDNNNASKDWLL